MTICPHITDKSYLQVNSHDVLHIVHSVNSDGVIVVHCRIEQEHVSVEIVHFSVDRATAA